MRGRSLHSCALWAVLPVFLAMQLSSLGQDGGTKSAVSQPPQAQLKDTLEARVKAEWEAIKLRDKKAYGDLLTDDFLAVEVDGRGTRNKLQAINELEMSNVRDYTLFGFSVIPLGPHAAFTTYESTMRFFPKAQVHFLRVYVGELWVNEGGHWKARHYQETNVR